jgi:predicted nucleic acid-binding protein
MKIMIDTSIWSLVFRRKEGGRDNHIVAELIDLMRDLRVAIIGSIRQELLSGITDQKKFLELKEKMRGFTDEPIQTVDYELAAEFSNKCRKCGIQGSHTDFLICAVAVRNSWKIFTTDNDFLHYQKHIPIVLHTYRDKEN